MYVRGTANPLCVSLEGFLEDMALNLKMEATGLALVPASPCSVHDPAGQEGGVPCTGGRGAPAR